MLLALDWRMSAKGFAWANAVIAANPTLPVIVTTHEIVGSYDDGTAGLSDYGQQMWDNLIKDNDQIFLALNGHYWPPGSTVMKNSAGNDVAANTVVKDQAGNGNDLFLRSVSGTPAHPLTWTGDHHPDQPGHAGLAFAGQGNPVSGAYFQTIDRAPINQETFAHGYTFEVFFKVPSDWDGGRNGWSSMLSRAGTAGQAGKNGPSATADEPILTLSLSSSIELRWNAYPLNQNGATTAWSHLLQKEQWWHVAVTNDGRISKLYVNGCEEGRNPTSTAIGLTTLKMPFLLGGYQWAGAVSQVFHGTIGDVRIVNRALSPREFMNA